MVSSDSNQRAQPFQIKQCLALEWISIDHHQSLMQKLSLMKSYAQFWWRDQHWFSSGWKYNSNLCKSKIVLWSFLVQGLLCILSDLSDLPFWLQSENLASKKSVHNNFILASFYHSCNIFLKCVRLQSRAPFANEIPNSLLFWTSVVLI